MKKTIAVLLIILLPKLLAAQVNLSTENSIVFTNVTIIDMTGSAPKSDMTLVVTGNRITALGESGKISVPQNARIVNARGKFLIPGLWDMHTHGYWKAESVEKTFFPLLVANGVTSIRELHNVYPIKQFNRWRQQRAEGKLLAPAIASVGRKVDSRTGISIKVSSEEQARAAVRQIKREGWDFVKVYSYLSREAFFAIADEAKKQNIPIAGHVPLTVGAGEASDAGLRSIEHLSEMLISTSTEEETLRREVLEYSKKVDALAGKPLSTELIDEDQRLLEKHFLTYSEQKAAALAEKFVKNNTFHCPTLVVFKNNLLSDEPENDYQLRLRYVPQFIKKYYQAEQESVIRKTPPERLKTELEDRKRTFDKRQEILLLLHQKGVQILAGSDASAPAARIVVPGFSLHNELQLLVKAGLSPFESLKTATLNPAKFHNLSDSLGTIERGKIADLVLLDANPLEDIGNTKKINSVVLNGRLFDRKTLDKLLTDVENAAKNQ